LACTQALQQGVCKPVHIPLFVGTRREYPLHCSCSVLRYVLIAAAAAAATAD